MSIMSCDKNIGNMSFKQAAQRYNICFICPGLEPGKDAVGDYTVALSQSLVKHGVDCHIIAIADHYVTSHSEGSRAGCRILRLPKKSDWYLRRRQLAGHVSKIEPKWVSLQWVAFGHSSFRSLAEE